MEAQTNSRGAVGLAPVVVIPADLKRLLDLYISQCKFEISGLGEVEVQNGVPTVTSLHLLKQEVTEYSTRLSAVSVATFMAEAAGNGVQLDKIRLWWHSHATMGVCWSQQDEEAIASFGSAPWWLSIVGNHKGEYLARVDVFPSAGVPLRLSHPALLHVRHRPEEVLMVRDEIERLVQEAPKPQLATDPEADTEAAVEAIRRKPSRRGARQPASANGS